MLRTLLPARVRVAVVAAAACVVALAGCSGGGGGSSSATSAAPRPSSPSASGKALITIKDFSFHPAALTVAPGTRVTVINKDATAHTVTATRAKAFDTGDVNPGQTVTFTAPAGVGSYPYICTIHPTMKGSLTVR
ncbi:cupredoxin domain-containing protein [Streptomyces sp. NPDC091265]|uniref:cupredoxin domain-containing protein n=1 Tax=unclassified Streptomyces TaxID=2593676 RepID=UPI00344BE5B4